MLVRVSAYLPSVKVSDLGAPHCTSSPRRCSSVSRLLHQPLTSLTPHSSVISTMGLCCSSNATDSASASSHEQHRPSASAALSQPQAIASSSLTASSRSAQLDNMQQSTSQPAAVLMGSQQLSVEQK